MNAAVIIGFIIAAGFLLSLLIFATWGCYGVYKYFKARCVLLYPKTVVVEEIESVHKLSLIIFILFAAGLMIVNML